MFCCGLVLYTTQACFSVLCIYFCPYSSWKFLIFNVLVKYKSILLLFQLFSTITPRPFIIQAETLAVYSLFTGEKREAVKMEFEECVKTASFCSTGHICVNSGWTYIASKKNLIWPGLASHFYFVLPALLNATYHNYTYSTHNNVFLIMNHNSGS